MDHWNLPALVGAQAESMSRPCFAEIRPMKEKHKLTEPLVFPVHHVKCRHWIARAKTSTINFISTKSFNRYSITTYCLLHRLSTTWHPPPPTTHYRLPTTWWPTVYYLLPTTTSTYYYLLLLPTTTYYYLLLPTTTYYYLLLPTTTYYYLLLIVATSTYCYLLLPTATYCYLLLPLPTTTMLAKVLALFGTRMRKHGIPEGWRWNNVGLCKAIHGISAEEAEEYLHESQFLYTLFPKYKFQIEMK